MKAYSLSSHIFSTLYLVMYMPFFLGRLWFLSLNNSENYSIHLGRGIMCHTVWFHECRNVFIRWWAGKKSLRSLISTSNYCFLLSHWPEGHRGGIRFEMPKDVYSEMQIFWYVFKKGKRKSNSELRFIPWCSLNI